MNISVGCQYAPGVEELIETLPGAKKDIYEDDAEDLLEQIAAQNAMKPVSAWKELTVTAVGEKDLELDGVLLKCQVLAEKLSVGDKLYGAVFTAGKELHQMLEDCDDIMQEYILGFLMSHILTLKTVDVVEELIKTTGLNHVEMFMAGIPDVCAMDQQIQIAKMLESEFEAAGVCVKKGGSLNPTYSSTALFLISDREVNVPVNWNDKTERNAFGGMLFESAGHS